MYGAVRVDLKCNNQAGALQVRDAINAYVATLPAVQVYRSVIEVISKHGGFFVSGELIYGDPLDAQRIFTRVQTIWSNATYNTIVLPGSTTDWHECHADEGLAVCVILPANTATK